MKNIFKDEKRPQDGEIWCFKFDNTAEGIRNFRRNCLIVRIKDGDFTKESHNKCYSLIDMSGQFIFGERDSNFGLCNCTSAYKANIIDQRKLCAFEEAAGISYMPKEEAAQILADVNRPFLNNERPKNGEIWIFKHISIHHSGNYIIARIKGEFTSADPDIYGDVEQLCHSCIDLSGKFFTGESIYFNNDSIEISKLTGEKLRDFIETEYGNDFSWKAKAVEEFNSYIEEMDTFLKEQEAEYGPTYDWVSEFNEILNEHELILTRSFVAPPTSKFITINITFPDDFFKNCILGSMPSDACAVMSKSIAPKAEIDFNSALYEKRMNDKIIIPNLNPGISFPTPNKDQVYFCLKANCENMGGFHCGNCLFLKKNSDEFTKRNIDDDNK